jgi:plastocyanin
MEPTQDQNQTPYSVVLAPAKKSRKKFVFAVCAILIAGAAAVFLVYGRGQVSAKDMAIVSVTQKGFGPAAIHVKKGQQVTWTNNDTGAHEVVSDSKAAQNDPNAFDSEALGYQDSYTVTFDQAGTYSYHDQLNPYTNKGQVIVE